jgi:myotubularin-related protein 6/7/8
VNNCSITRSSQPLVGVGNKRSVQDERLVSAIFSTSRPRDLQLEASVASSTSISGTNTPNSEVADISRDNVESVQNKEDQMGTSFTSIPVKDAEDIVKVKPKHVYGAQQSNMIVDARPTINAYAMQAVGMGSENMDNYPWATKEYLGIANIHVMRDSLNKVVDALKDYDLTSLPPNREQLAKSGWLKHISQILKGAKLIAERVGLQHSHVLIHCSDGWDRTSQLSALSQLCLDPFYRTINGFIVLVEKDWLSFGHMFHHRSGFLSSEKWFEVENERIGGNRNISAGSSPSNASGATTAFQGAMKQAKGFFNRKNDSRESLAESDSENPYDISPANKRSSQGSHDHVKTKVKETSPVFHQFLDATYQLVHQHPTRFEFNERFLRRLLYHLYSCQYGTFLYDNEKARREARVAERTRSVWDYFLARRHDFTNPDYDAEIDDHIPGKERLLFPDDTETRWWADAFGRKDQDLNGMVAETGLAVSNDIVPVITGVEGSEGAIGVVLPEDEHEPEPGLGLGTGPGDMPKARLEGYLKSTESSKNESDSGNKLATAFASLGLGSSEGWSGGVSPNRSQTRTPLKDTEAEGLELK